MNKKNLIIFVSIIFLDQLTKYYVINKNIEIIPNIFKITYTQNTGAAFGIGSINIITILDILLLIGFIGFLIIKKDKINTILPFILIISGTIGNLIDRIYRGYVIDFLDINVLNFPNFNIADICITSGIFILIYIIIKNIYK